MPVVNYLVRRQPFQQRPFFARWAMRIRTWASAAILTTYPTTMGIAFTCSIISLFISRVSKSLISSVPFSSSGITHQLELERVHVLIPSLCVQLLQFQNSHGIGRDAHIQTFEWQNSNISHWPQWRLECLRQWLLYVLGIIWEYWD